MSQDNVPETKKDIKAIIIEHLTIPSLQKHYEYKSENQHA